MDYTDRRTILESIGTAAALSTVGVGAVAARKRKGASADGTIVDVATEANDFDVLVEAVTEAGLASTLSGDEQFTVFAPTDQAFLDLLNALGVTKKELLARDDLADILLYHVTEGRRYAASVTNPAPVETLEGSSIEVDGTALNGGSTVLGGADIVDTNIEASNGVVHVIDGVLLPP